MQKNLLLLIFPIVACASQATINQREKNDKVIFSGKIDGVQLTTVTDGGAPADRVNLVFEVESEGALLRCFFESGWSAADDLSFVKLGREVGDILRNRQYDQAPVSSLKLFGRKQDLAFEIEDGKSPRKRHHIRLWESVFQKSDGQRLWFAAATYDTNVEWRKLTHSTDFLIDKERDFVRNRLDKCVESVEAISSKDPLLEKKLVSDNKVFFLKLKPVRK